MIIMPDMASAAGEPFRDDCDSEVEAAEEGVDADPQARLQPPVLGR